MAGETPGANASRRKKLPWADDKSTNKVYASGEISAIGPQTAADSVKRADGQAGVATPVVRADDKSADKYYAAGGSQRVRGPQVAAGQKKLGPPPKLGIQPKTMVDRPGPNTKLHVDDQTQINGVLGHLVERLKGGATSVVLSVKAGDGQLLRRTRASLELLVTREVITEEQYHEVRLSYEQTAVLPPPEPQAVVAVPDDAAIGDPKDFLNADSDDEDTIDTSAVAAPPEVDTTDDVPSSPAPSHPTAPEGDDEDDSDYEPRGQQANTVLVDDKQEVEPVTDVTAPAEQPSPVEEAPADEDNKPRRGRRSGRGTN